MSLDRFDRKPKELPAFPMLQMFGGLIGVLVVIVVLSAIKVQQVRNEQLKPENLVGIQSVDLSVKPQIKLFLYNDYILVDQTGEKIPARELLKSQNAMTRYLRPMLNDINTGRKELFLLLYPESNRTMFATRQLLSNIKVRRFNMLMLNKELIRQLMDTDITR